MRENVNTEYSSVPKRNAGPNKRTGGKISLHDFNDD